MVEMKPLGDDDSECESAATDLMATLPSAKKPGFVRFVIGRRTCRECLHYLRPRAFVVPPSFFSVPLIRFLDARSTDYADNIRERSQSSVTTFSIYALCSSSNI